MATSTRSAISFSSPRSTVQQYRHFSAPARRVSSRKETRLGPICFQAFGERQKMQGVPFALAGGVGYDEATF